MTTRSLVGFASLVALALAAVGCAAETSGPGEEHGTSQSALHAGGGGGGGGGGGRTPHFRCDSAFCSCVGDDDCNEMYSAHVCRGAGWCVDDACQCPR